MKKQMIIRCVGLLCCWLVAAFPVAGRVVDEVIPNENAAVSRLINRLRPFSGSDRLEGCLESCRSLGVSFNSSCVDRCLSRVNFPYAVQDAVQETAPPRLNLVERAAERILTLVKAYMMDRAPTRDPGRTGAGAGGGRP